VIGLGCRRRPSGSSPISATPWSGACRALPYHFLGDHPTPSELFPGVVETLEGLADAGYLLGIATGKSRRGLDKVLGETGLGRLFHASLAPTRPSRSLTPRCWRR